MAKKMERVPPTALELLTEDRSDRIKPWLNQFMAPAFGTAFGLTSSMVYNYYVKKPTISGIQRHVVLMVGCALAAQLFAKKRGEYNAERDAVLRHYVELHPEDFIMPERKKIGEILMPWVPIR